MKSLTTLIGLWLLAACASTTTITPGGLVQSDECSARSQRGLMGTIVTDPASVALAAPKVRIIRPSDAVTQDFQPDRLNVILDAGNRVVDLTCG